VKVAKNDTYLDRETTITVKCGTTREKVTLSQSGGEVDIDMPEGYHLVWRDEFSEGSVPSSQWWYETGAGGWGNNEIQEYVAQNKDGKDIAYVSNGTLKIAAQKIDNKVYSVRMNTTQGWTYGWFEARIKVTDARGSWPAFWMMPKNFKTWPGDGEIDIMEYAIGTQGKDKSSSSIHCNAFNWPAGTQKTHVMPVNNAASEFHVYALEWTADYMKFYVDGNLHLTFANDGKGYSHWPFDNPFYLKFNLAYGGNMGGQTDDAKLPALYEVDYVRVFKKK
jgi:beta-glucanase (GH16 family)